MKSVLKRAVFLFLAVVMLTSLCLSFTLTAAAYSYNTGKKGTLCTALSASAKSYYTTGYDYATLSVLSGTALEAKLRERMTSGWHGGSYDSLKSSFKYTDAYNGSSSSVYCFYSNTSVTSWNREHVWPQSKGDFTTESYTAGSDVIHLRPTDNTANSTRSNLPYGEVTGGTYQTVYTSSGKVAGYYSPAFYEPLDSVKGDVARILLYVYTRWEQRNLTDVIDSVDLLLKWCEEDPVDEYEMKRNDICEEICGSRNVFVDYPEYCWRVFGKAIPTHMKTPSGMGNTCDNPQYESAVTTAATCTGNGVMTYTCKNCGYAYTEAIPSQGHHYVSGVCTVCGAKQASVQYIYTASIAAGDEVVIFNPSNKKVLTTSATTYTKDNVVYDRLKGAAATVAGTELTTSATDVATFTVEKSGSNYAFKLSDGRYLTCETSEYLTLTASPKSGTNKWVLEDSGTDGWYIKNTTTYYQDYQKNYAYIEYFYTFTTYGFKGTAGQAAYNMNFYKVQRANICDHDYQITATKGATCTEKGYTTYQCTKCADTYTTYTDALGHLYEVETVAPTTTEQGYDLHTCSRCGNTYKDNYVPVLEKECEHEHTELRNVSAPDCTTDGYTGDTYCTDCNALLVRGEVIPALGHNYVDGECIRCHAEDPDYVPGDPCEGYTDIDRNAWYHAYADFVISAGIMGSTKTDALTFEPGTACTRAMVVSILYRLAGSPAVEYTAKFPDVPDGKWFTDAVIWAANTGVVAGNGDGTFAPNGKITREQMAVILMGYTEKVLGKSVKERANIADFPDEGKVTWSRNAVRWAVAMGLISGKQIDGIAYLVPQGNATRAEVATILTKFLKMAY